MTSDRPLTALTLASLLCTTPTSAAEPLRHDVFARPTLAALVVTASESPVSSTTVAWSPRLTAVMVAGSSSLATIDGRILRIGEQTDGYRLVSVRESEAILVKDGQRFVLTMVAPAPTSTKNRGEE